MRQLHVVGVSRDGRALVLSADPDAPRGGYRLMIDDHLHAALRGDIGRPGQAGRPESKLSPREIQTRLRAGQSAEEVAKIAAVPLARVERFAGPVLAERQRVLDEALSAYFVKPRRGTSAWPLGRAVAAHLDALAGLDPDSLTWSATRDPAGTWVVRLDYVVHGRRRKAQWAWDAASEELRALDTNAGQLAHLDAPPEGPARVRRRRSGEGGARRAPAGRAARTATSAPATSAPDAPDVAPAVPAQPDRPPRPADARDTDARDGASPPEGAPPADEAGRSDAADPGDGPRPAPRPRRRVAARGPEDSADVLPLRPGRRRRRAQVPSWDDVLLGGGTGSARADDDESAGDAPGPRDRRGAAESGRSAPRRWRRRRSER